MMARSASFFDRIAGIWADAAVGLACECALARTCEMPCVTIDFGNNKIMCALARTCEMPFNFNRLANLQMSALSRARMFRTIFSF